MKDEPIASAARDSGRVAHEDGISAEEAVARAYQRRGAAVAARRWRGAAGEIDLILREGDEVVFVEVKKARDFDRAAARLGARQLRRIAGAASEFLAGEPAGLLTPSRIDAALVDSRGEIRLLRNVTLY